MKKIPTEKSNPLGNQFRFLTKRLALILGGFFGLAALVIIGVWIYSKQAPPATTNRPGETQVANDTPQGWAPRKVEKELMPEEVELGHKLLSETAKYLGPQAEKSEMRLSGNNLNCTSCHLQDGNKRGAAAWAGVTQRYPSFRGRSNAMGTIEDRINGCMERSMNGKMLSIDSQEMKAMVAYMEWLGEGMTKEDAEDFSGFAKLEIPDKAVDLDKGKQVFVQHCVLCHQQDGQGVKNRDFKEGYQYPPLWGDDSFNDGAGMHRVLTAAQYIKANMPYLQASIDQPVLTDEEAFNVAGYINSFNRPSKSDKEKDFPDRSLKPVSTPYGPWADDFPAEQHKYGPFPPIIAFYKDKFDITKTK